MIVCGVDGYAFRSADGPTCKETSFRLALVRFVLAVVQLFTGAWSSLVSSIG